MTAKFDTRFFLLTLFCVSFYLESNALHSYAAENFCHSNKLIKMQTLVNEPVDHVCAASEKALRFLSRYGLQLLEPITIEIIDEGINSGGYIAFGSYDRQLDLIRIMSYSAILKNSSPQMYDQPFDMEHYLGAIAHEVAHAVYHQNSKKVVDQLTNATQEYLAHATQLGVLSAERRLQIIESSKVGSWESGDSISDTYMALNPTGFAVKSYLHLTGLQDPQPFIKILLNNNWFYVSVP